MAPEAEQVRLRGCRDSCYMRVILRPGCTLLSPEGLLKNTDASALSLEILIQLVRVRSLAFLLFKK